MFHKINLLLDEIDNDNAPLFRQLLSGAIWLVILGCFSAICIAAAAAFSTAM